MSVNNSPNPAAPNHRSAAAALACLVLPGCLASRIAALPARSEVVQIPQPSDRCMSERRFPPLGWKSAHPGAVRFRASVDPAGRVRARHAEEGEASPWLADATELIDACAFSPALVDGIARDSEVVATYSSKSGILHLAWIDVVGVASEPFVEPDGTCPSHYPSTPLGGLREGNARLELTVGADGSVVGPRVVSAAPEEFGRAALAGIPECRFRPAVLGGRRTAARLAYRYRFVLR